jgi:hypothetical protein
MSVSIFIHPVVVHQQTGTFKHLRPYFDRVAEWWEETAGVYVAFTNVTNYDPIPQGEDGAFLWDSRDSGAWEGAEKLRQHWGKIGRHETDHKLLVIDPLWTPSGYAGAAGLNTAMIGRELLTLTAQNWNDRACGLLAHMVGHLLGLGHSDSEFCVMARSNRWAWWPHCDVTVVPLPSLLPKEGCLSWTL